MTVANYPEAETPKGMPRKSSLIVIDARRALLQAIRLPPFSGLKSCLESSGAGGILSSMNPRIQITPTVCHGKPVIRGTRVLVSTILGALSGGDTIEMVLQDYPSISADDVAAALEFAGRLSDYQMSDYEVFA
jgi:uncharacterized protein (DUF433 family)